MKSDGPKRNTTYNDNSSNPQVRMNKTTVSTILKTVYNFENPKWCDWDFLFAQ